MSDKPYKDALFYYQQYPQCLQTAVIDIPVCVLGEDTHFSPGYLLSLNLYAQKCVVKIIVSDLPHPPITGTQIVGQPQKPDFLYKEVSMDQVTLLQDLHLQEFEFPLEPVEDLPQIKIFQNLDEQRMEYAQFSMSYLLSLKNQNFDFQTDFQDRNIENLQKWSQRVILKKISQRIISEQVAITKVVPQEMLSNRKVLNYLKYNVRTDEIYTKKYKLTEQDNLDFQIVKEKINQSLVAKQFYSNQLFLWNKQFIAFFKSVLQNFIEQYDNSGQLIQFLTYQLNSVQQTQNDAYNYITIYIKATIETIKNLSTKLTNVYNVDKVNYHILLLLCVKQEIIPIIAFTESILFYEKNKEKFDEKYNLQQIYTLTKQVIFSVFAQIVEPALQQMDKLLHTNSDHNQMNQYLKTNIESLSILENKRHILSLFVRTFAITDDVIDQDLLQSSLFIWSFEYDLICHCFNSIQFDYVNNFNYVNLTNNLQLEFITFNSNKQQEIIKIKINTAQEILKQLMQNFNENKVVLKSYNMIAQNSCLIEDINQLSFQLNIFFQTDKIQSDSVMLVKLHKQLNMLQQVAGYNSIPKLEAPIKKIQDLDHFSINQLQTDNLVIDYDVFINQIQTIETLLGYLKDTSKYILNFSFFEIDLQEYVKDLEQQLKSAEKTIQTQVNQIINKFSQKLSHEITYLRKLYQNCLENPAYFKLGDQIRQYFTGKLLYSIIINMSNVLYENSERFLRKFPPLAAVAEKFNERTFQNLTRPICLLFQFTKELKIKQLDLSLFRQDILSIINQVDDWINNSCQQLNQTIQYIITEFDTEEIDLKIDQLLKHFQFDIPVFDFKCNQDVEKYILHTLAKSTELQINSINFGTDVLLKNYRHSHITQPKTLTDKAELQFNKKYQFYKEITTLDIFLSHLYFILFELSSIQSCTCRWRQWIVQTIKDDNAQFINLRTTTSPSQLLLALYPITTVINTRVELNDILAQDIKVKDFPAEFLLQLIEKTTVSIKIIRLRSESNYQILSNKTDWLKSGYIKNEHRQDVLNSSIINTVNYQCWNEIINQIEQIICNAMGRISFIYFLQDPQFEPHHFQKFQKLTQIPLDKQLNQKAQSLFDIINNKPEILDFVLILRQNVRIDQDASKKLSQIFDLLNSVVAGGVYQVRVTLNQNQKILDSKLVQKMKGKSNIIDLTQLSFIQITPVFWDGLCSEMLAQVSLYINNIGFQGKRTTQCLSSYDILFEQTYFEIYEKYQNQQQNREQQELMKQWRYNLKVENKSRDFEALIQVLKMVLTCFKYLPTMLYDLLLIYNNNQLIQYQNFKYQFSVQLINGSNEKLLIEYLYTWQLLITKYITIQHELPIIQLVYNQEFCEILTNIYASVSQLHHDIMTRPFSNILEVLSPDIINGRFGEVTISQQILDNSIIVPHFHLKSGIIFKYYKSLNLVMPFHLKFSQFDQNNKVFNQKNIIQQYYPGVESFLYEKNNIVGLKLNTGIHIFQKPINTPKYVYQILDEIDQSLKNTLLSKALFIWDIFNIIYQYFKEQEQPRITDQYKMASGQKVEYSDPQLNASELFFKKTDNQTRKLIINTHFMQYYREAIKNKLVDLDILFLQRQISFIQYLVVNFTDNTEIIMLLNTFLTLYQCIQQAESAEVWIKQRGQYNITTQIFDFLHSKIQVQNVTQDFSLEIGYTYQNIQQYDISSVLNQLSLIYDSFQRRQTVFLLGSKQQGNLNSQLKIIVNCLQTQLQRRVIKLYVSPFNFDTQFKKIEQYIICGNFVVISGLLNLNNSQVQQLVNFTQNLSQKQGQFQYHFISKDITSVTDKATKLQGSLQQKSIQLVPIQIKDIEDLGHIIFFIPEMYFSQNNSNFYFIDKDIKYLSNYQNIKMAVNNSKQNSFSVSHQQSYQLDVENNIVRQLERFYQGSIIKLTVDDTLQQYNQVSQIYGSAFFDLALILQQFNQDFINVKVNDMKIILQKSTDINDIQAIASICCDYIMKQNLQILQDSEDIIQSYSMIAYLVASAFGLDAVQTAQQMSASRSFYQYNEAIVQYIGISRKNTRQFNMKYNTFQSYFRDYFEKYMERTLVEKIYLNHQLHQISLQCSYDLMFINDLLILKEPLLLINYNQTYLKQFLTLLELSQQQQIKIIFDSYSLEQYVQQQYFSENDLLQTIFVSPTSEKEFDLISDILIQIQNDNIQAIVSIDYTIYDFIKTSSSMIFYNHKIALIPSYDQSVSNKKLFLAQLNINKYYYSQVIELKLRNIWINKQEQQSNVISILRDNIKLKSLVSANKEHDMMKIENRTMVLQSYIHGIYSYIFDIVIGVFNISPSFEDSILLRNMIFIFLKKYDIVQVSKRSHQNIFLDSSVKTSQQLNFNLIQDLIAKNNPSIGIDVIQRIQLNQYNESENMGVQYDQYIQDEFDLQRININTIQQPIQDIGGFNMSNLNTNQLEYNRLIKTSKDKDQTLQNLIGQYLTDFSAQTGSGLNGSIKFEFKDEFLSDQYFQPHKHSQAFQNIFVPLFSAIWNSILLFYQHIQFGSKQKSVHQDSFLELINEKYSQIINVIQTGDQANQQVQVVLVPVNALLAYDDQEQFPNLNLDVLKTLNSKSFFPLHKMNIGISTEQQLRIFKQFCKQSVISLPDNIASTFSYLNYKNQKSFIQKYQLGVGIMQNLSDYSEQEIIDAAIVKTSQQILEKRIGQLSGDTNSYNQDNLVDQNLQQNSVSIQKISQDLLYIDEHRASFIVLVGACLLSSITTSLVGNAKTGKTTLIRIGQLFVRDLIDPGFIDITGKLTSQNVIGQTLKAVAQKFVIRNYDCLQQSRYSSNVKQNIPASLYTIQSRSIMDYYQTMAFPTFHLNISDSQDTQIPDELILLLKEHLFKFSNDMKVMVDNVQQRLEGVSTLSDCSFILESGQDSSIHQLASVQLFVPVLQESFYIQFLSKLFPQYDKSYVQQFVNGYFMLKSSFDIKFLHNFEFLSYLITNQMYAIKSQEVESPQLHSQATDYDPGIQIIMNQMQNLSTFILNSKDNITYELSVHSLFNILGLVLDSTTLQQLQERLASLDILGYLDDIVIDGNLQDNPWQDCLIVIEQDFKVKPCWQSFIQNSTISNHFLKQDISFTPIIIDTFLQTDTTLSPLSTIHELLDWESLVSSGYKKFNESFFINVIKIYQKFNYNPELTSSIIRTISRLLMTKELNQAQLSSYLSFGIEVNDNNSLSGIGSECESLYLRQFLVNQASKYAALVGNFIDKDKKDNINQQFYQQDLDMYDMQKQYELDTEVSTFGGLPYATSFILKIFYDKINVMHYVEGTNDYIIKFISEITQSLVIHNQPLQFKYPISFETCQNNSGEGSQQSNSKSEKSSQVSSQSTLKQKIKSRFYDISKEDSQQQEKLTYIVDIQSIQGQISMNQQAQEKSGFDISSYIINIIQKYRKVNKYTDQQLDAIQIIMILRISIGMCLGIRPDVVVSQDYNNDIPDIFEGIKINSQLISVFPSKLVPNGRFLSSLPIKCTSWSEMALKYLQRKRKAKRNKSQLLDDMTMLPLELMLIIDSFTMNSNIVPDLKIKELLRRLISPMNLISNIFTTEELQCLSILVCHNFQIESILDYKMLSAIIASNLSIIELDNTPKLLANYSSIESIDIPIFQINQYKKDYSKDISSMFKSLLQNQKILKPIIQKVEKQHERIYYSNLLTQKRNSLFDLFYLSGCKRTKQIKYEFIEFDFQKFEKDFIYCQVIAYKEFNMYAKYPIMNFIKFTEMCVFIADKVLNKLVNIDLVYQKTYNLLKFYENLAEPAKQPIRYLQLQDINMNYFQDIINKMLLKIYDQSVQDGIPLTPEQQKVQTAIAEFVMFRDFFATSIKDLQSELSFQQISLKSLAVDVVGAACFTIFGLNDNLNDEKFLQAIHTGYYGDLEAHLTRVYNNLDIYYSKFNFQYLLILQYYGFCVRYPEPQFKDRLISQKQVPEDTIFVGNNSLSGGKYMLLNNIIEMINPDWPILAVIEYYQFSWQIGDPYYAILQTSLLNFNVGFNIQFIDDKLARAAGLCIASQYYKVASQNVISKLVNQISYDQESINQLIQMLQDHTQYINICDPLGISLQKIKAGILGKKVLVFNNFQFNNANIKLLMLVRKLLIFKISPHSANQYNIILGPLKLVSPVLLKDIPVILGYDSSFNIHEILKQLDLYSSQLIDNSSIQQLQLEQQENVQYTICENLITEIFGTVYNDRYSREQVRTAKTQILISGNALHQLYLTYFKMHIAKNLLKYKINYNDLTFQIDTINHERVVNLALEFSAFASQNKPQCKMIDILFKSIKTFNRSRFQLNTLIDVDQFIDEVNFDFELLCLSKQLVTKFVYDKFLRISQGVQVLQETMKSLLVFHNPLISLTGQEFLSLIMLKIKEKIPVFKQSIINELESVVRELSDKEQQQYQVKIFVDEFPLIYKSKQQSVDLVLFVLNCIMDIISSRIALVMPEDLISPLWFIAFTTIFGITGILSVDNVQGQYNDIALINQIFTNNYQDYTKLVCSQQISLAFNPNNIFSIQKMYSPAQIRKYLRKIQNIKQVIPELCRMSSQLQFSWISMQILSRYNKLMKNTMQFFLKNTATFVNLSKVRSPLLAMIRGFAVKYPTWLNSMLTKSDEHRWLFDQLYKTQENNQVQVPPKGFNINDYSSYYAMFLISAILKPENIIYDIETLATLLSGNNGGSPFQLFNQLSANTQLQQSGICQTQFQLPHDELMKFFQPSFDYFQKQMQISESFSCASLLDPIVYQFSQQIVSVINRSEKENISIGIIFYDPYLHISKLIEIVSKQLLKNSIKYEISDKELEKTDILQFTLLDTFSFSEQIEQVINQIMLSKISQSKLHPWIILIPSNLYGEDYHDEIQRQLSSKYIENWGDSLSRLIEASNPLFCYLQKPNNPHHSLQHNITILIQTFSQYSPQNIQIRLFNYQSLILYVVNNSLHFKELRGDKTLYDEYSLLVQKCFTPNQLSYHIVQQTPQEFQDFISLQQLNFDDVLKTLIKTKANLTEFIPEKIIISMNDQRTISLNANDAIVEILNDKQESSSSEDDDFLDENSRSSMSNLSNNSMMESSQQTATETSDLSTTQAFGSNETRKKAKPKFAKQKFDFYDVLINALHNYKDPFLNVLDIQKMHNTIFQTVNQQERKIQQIPSPFDQQIPSTFTSITTTLKQLENLSEKISIQSQDSTQRVFLRRSLSLQFSEKLSRQFLTSREARAVSTKQLYNRVESNKIESIEIAKTLPNQLGIFNKSLQQIPDPMYFTNIQQSFHMFQNILQYDIEVVSRPIFFQAFEFSWKIDAQAAIFTLGNIFNYARVLHSLKTLVPLQFTRVIGLMEKPTQQPVLLQNGDIGYCQETPFYIEVVNLQLYGASYDAVQQQIVHYTSADLQGFVEEFSVYFVVVTTEKMDEVDIKNYENAVIVNRKYIPIEVRCGGICKPVVLIENKSQLSAEEFLRGEVYFSVGVL